MNVIFSFLFFLSAALLFFFEPTNFLSALLDGATKSATTCIALIATYSVWLGLMRVWEDSGVSRAFSKLLRPVACKLFRTDDTETITAISMNLSSNLLGIGGAATPYGIKAAQLLDKSPNAEYSSAMFFVLNATSLQIFPSSMIAVRVAMHSASPYDIILPTLTTTVFSTMVGVFLTKIYFNADMVGAKRHNLQEKSRLSPIKIKGAGMR
jgi:spore maturation protein A